MTKIVILVFNGNASLNSFQITAFRHNFVQRVRQNHQILIMLIKFPMRMRNTKWSRKVTQQSKFEKILRVTVHTTFESNWNNELSLYFVMQIPRYYDNRNIKGLIWITNKGRSWFQFDSNKE